jgi:hypothetical protein
MVCNLVEGYLSFRGSAASIFSVEGFLLRVHFPPKMKTVGSAKTPVPYYRTTQYNILEAKLAGLERALSKKLGRNTVYPDCGFSQFSSVTQGKMLDQATTTSSQILSKPSVIPPSDNIYST